MKNKLLKSMVDLSNNSKLSTHAANILTHAISAMTDADAHVVEMWLQHAKREAQVKINHLKKKK